MNRTRLLIVCCGLLVVPGLAQNPQNHKSCSPVGTWYGGGDYKYVITIAPVTGNTFTITSEGVYSQAAFGYTAWTSWSGQLLSLKDGRYLAHEVSMYTTSPEIQPPTNSIELDAVRGWMTFIDCANIQFSYDFFGAYFDLNKVPFVDPVDLSYLPPGGLIETYHRMPTKCPACGFASTVTSHLQQKRH